MRVIFCGVFYYQGETRYLFHIFEVFRKIARVFKVMGIDCYFFAKQNNLLPNEKTIGEEEFEKMLPETDCVFIWNGSLAKEKEIVETCKKQGTPVYFCELGWLPQRGNIYFDKKGINYESSLRDWKFKELNKEESLFVNGKLAYYHNKAARFSNIAVPDNFVFVPLQVENDSQITVFSPRIKSMQALIDYVCQYIEGTIVFKIHPGQKDVQVTVPGNCIIAREGTTHDYLRKCRYTVTINSTVGVEALSYNLPVITLGQAFYESRKMTYSVHEDQDMVEAVKWAEGGKTALAVIQSFLHHLFTKQWHRTELNNPQKVVKLIEGLTE